MTEVVYLFHYIFGKVGEMSNKEDLRVKRTKRALYDAFMCLLSEKSFEEITVNELCASAGIRRATFYKHYSDKFSFLTSYTRSLRDRFDTTVWKLGDPAPDREYYVAYAKRIVGFVCENISAIENLITNDLFPAVLAIIVEQNYKDTCEHLEKSVASGMVLRASVSVTANMCAGGVATVICSWLKGGRRQSADEIANEIGAMISSIIGNLEN